MNMLEKKNMQSHRWSFFRSGGVEQVRLDCGRDLTELINLDRKLWVALSCPIDNVYFDKKH